MTYSSSSTVRVRRGSIVVASIWVRISGGIAVRVAFELAVAVRHGECWAQTGDRVQACASDSRSEASRQMRELRKDALTERNANCAAQLSWLAMQLRWRQMLLLLMRQWACCDDGDVGDWEIKPQFSSGSRPSDSRHPMAEPATLAIIGPTSWHSSVHPYRKRHHRTASTPAAPPHYQLHLGCLDTLGLVVKSIFLHFWWICMLEHSTKALPLRPRHMCFDTARW
jgi:hypothetical protein